MKYEQASATISDCGKYRYLLERTWDLRLPALGWVMLNPSTADADRDDPTIRRCVGFAQSLGYGGVRVVNLFAFRATNPSDLIAASLAQVDVVGPENDAMIEAACNTWPKVVAAWGGVRRSTRSSNDAPGRC